MRISIIEQGKRFKVEDNYKDIYEIYFIGYNGGKPGYVNVWGCTCPEWKLNSKKGCEHIKAFLLTRLKDKGDPYFKSLNIPTEVIL
jgi:hypothetical protein